MSSFWNDAREQLLKKLWGQGLSASQIARRMGGGVTRNAIIGKRIRMGLPDRGASTTRTKSGGRRCKKPKGQQPWRHLQVFGLVERTSPARLPKEEYTPPVDDYIVPMQQRKTVQTLEEDSCRWPIGDPQTPEFYFCGGEKVAGLSYCRRHVERAYVKPDQRRRTIYVPSEKQTEDA